MAANKLIAFRLRLLIDGLPTRSHNHAWWPKKFPSPNCPTCTQLDDSMHWLTCPASSQSLWSTRQTAEHDIAAFLAHVDVTGPRSMAASLLNAWWNPLSLVHGITGTIPGGEIEGMYNVVATSDSSPPKRQIII